MAAFYGISYYLNGQQAAFSARGATRLRRSGWTAGRTACLPPRPLSAMGMLRGWRLCCCLPSVRGAAFPCLAGGLRITVLHERWYLANAAGERAWRLFAVLGCAAVLRFAAPRQTACFGAPCAALLPSPLLRRHAAARLLIFSSGAGRRVTCTCFISLAPPLLFLSPLRAYVSCALRRHVWRWQHRASYQRRTPAPSCRWGQDAAFPGACGVRCASAISPCRAFIASGCATGAREHSSPAYKHDSRQCAQPRRGRFCHHLTREEIK